MPLFVAWSVVLMALSLVNFRRAKVVHSAFILTGKMNASLAPCALIIPKSCPRRHSRPLAPCGALGTFGKPCASWLPCGLRRTHPCTYCSC